MRARDSLWGTIELLVPAALVALSVMLLAAAVGATLLGAPRASQWRLFGEGALCWTAGVALFWLKPSSRAASLTRR